MNRTVEWLNGNKHRRYPFVENASLTGSGFTLPDSAVLDISAENAHSDAPLILESVVVNATAATPTVVFRFFWSTTLVTIEVPASAEFPYIAEAYTPLFSRVTIVFGDGIIDLVENYADGTYTISDGQVEPALLVYQNEHRVNSVRGTASGSTPALGNVGWIEGYNCRLIFDANSDEIRIVARRGAGAGLYCERLVDDEPTCDEVVLAINGQRPNTDGTFLISGDDGVEVVSDPENHELVIQKRSGNNNVICEDTNA